MAKGFGTGLIHGALASAAALLALALVVPAPEPAPEAAVPLPAPAAAARTGRPVESVARPDAPAATAAPVALPPAEISAGPAPRARPVNLPVGSEFARSADLAPPEPAIPVAPAGGASLTEAPAVVAPAAEPAPVSSAAPSRMPDPAAERVSVSRLTAPEAEAAPDISGLLSGNAPALPAAPAGLGDAAAPDDLPDPAAALPVAPAGTVRAATEPAPGIVQPGPARNRSENAAPSDISAGRAVSAPDLSTPPDLTELNALERN